VLYITPPHNYPFTSCEPEPPELVELQLRYREAIRSRGDQRGTPANPDALRVLIYQMRDDLAAMLKLEADRHAELMQGLAATPAAVGEYLRDSGLVAESPARARLPARIEGRDGAEMVLVAGGPFLYGSTQHDWLASDDEKPQRTLTLPDFYIDRLPVTNRLYAKFLDQTRPSPETAAAWIDLSATRPRSRLRRQGEGYQVLPGYEEHPVTGVSWHGAKAYADWAGKRLPSEQEWEKAARGTDGRNWPWGNRWIDEQCNVDRRVGNTTPVGAYGNSPSPCGCFDMAGNVWQWTRSIISHAPGEADDRVIRGGCWRNTSTNARCASRGSWRMTHRDDHIGFRCVIDAPEPQAAPSRQAP